VTCDLEGLAGFHSRYANCCGAKSHDELVVSPWALLSWSVNLETRKLVLSEKRANTAARFQELEAGAVVEGQVVAVSPMAVRWISGRVSSGLLHRSSSRGSLRELGGVCLGHGDRLKALITTYDPPGGRIGLEPALA